MFQIVYVRLTLKPQQTWNSPKRRQSYIQTPKSYSRPFIIESRERCKSDERVKFAGQIYRVPNARQRSDVLKVTRDHGGCVWSKLWKLQK